MKIWRKMCRNVKKESGLYKENRAVEAGGTKTLPTFHQRWPRKYGDNLFLFISDEIIFVKKKHLGFLQYSMLVVETSFDGESRQYLIKIFKHFDLIFRIYLNILYMFNIEFTLFHAQLVYKLLKLPLIVKSFNISFSLSKLV